VNWRSIDESEPVVVLRGIPAMEPLAYERWRRSRRLSTLGFIAFALQRVIAWSFAVTVHLLLAAVLVAIYLDAQRPDDGLVSVAFFRGRGGEEGKVVEAPQATADVPAPEPEKKPEPVPDPVPAPPTPAPEPVPEPSKPAPPPRPAPAPAPAPAAVAEDAAPKPSVIGGGASSAPSAPAAPPSSGGAVTDKEVEKDPTAALAAKRAGDLETLRRGGEKDIVVVGGAYDHVELVLQRLRVPHQVIEA
jgi:outer membrane biosynthesis protein TonB